MAWALDSAATPVVATTGTTVTLSHTLGAGSDRLVAVAGMVSKFRAVTGVTYNGVAMTAVALPAAGDEEARWFLMGEASLPAAGTYSVVITYDNTLSSSDVGIGHCVSFTGVTAPEEAAAGTSYGNVSSISDAVTTLTADVLMLSALAVQDPRTITPTGGQGTAVSALDGTANFARTRTYAWTGPTTPGLVTSSFTLSGASSRNAQHLVAIPLAAGGGALTAIHASPIESLATLAVTLTAPAEAVATTSAAVSPAVESLQGLSAAGSASALEILAQVARAIAAPLEAAGTAGTVSASVVAAIEALALTVRALSSPLESSGGVSRSQPIAWESLASLLAAHGTSVEVLQSVSQTQGIPLETILRLAVLSVVPLETLGAPVLSRLLRELDRSGHRLTGVDLSAHRLADRDHSAPHLTDTDHSGVSS